MNSKRLQTFNAETRRSQRRREFVNKPIPDPRPSAKDDFSFVASLKSAGYTFFISEQL
jgi:hypothetical protein